MSTSFAFGYGTSVASLEVKSTGDVEGVERRGNLSLARVGNGLGVVAVHVEAP